MSYELVSASSSLYFSNIPKEVEVGDRFSVSVRINANDQSINAISSIISFPENLLKPISINKDQSIINLWTGEPRISKGRISFEGVVLNPGFFGNNGLVLRVNFEARASGVVNMNFIEGSVLANDGLGSNVLASFIKSNFRINAPTLKEIPPKNIAENKVENNVKESKLVKLPVITNAPDNIYAKDSLVISGQGEPNLLTRIVFKDVSLRSLGEELLTRLQNKKTKLDTVLVKNDEMGNFEYVSNNNLIAGVYNATPFLVDEESNIEKPGLGKEILVKDSKIVKNLIILINVLGLFIPIVILCVIIYFIPWYSWLRMRVLKRKINLEEEQLEVSAKNLIKEEVKKEINNSIIKEPELPNLSVDTKTEVDKKINTSFFEKNYLKDIDIKNED